MLNIQCRQPNRTTMVRTLNLALFLGHPIFIRLFICLLVYCLWSVYRHCQEIRLHRTEYYNNS